MFFKKRGEGRKDPLEEDKGTPAEYIKEKI